MNSPDTGGEVAFVAEWTVAQNEDKAEGNHSGLSVGYGLFS